MTLWQREVNPRATTLIFHEELIFKNMQSMIVPE